MSFAGMTPTEIRNWLLGKTLNSLTNEQLDEIAALIKPASGQPWTSEQRALYSSLRLRISDVSALQTAIANRPANAPIVPIEFDVDGVGYAPAKLLTASREEDDPVDIYYYYKDLLWSYEIVAFETITFPEPEAP